MSPIAAELAKTELLRDAPDTVLMQVLACGKPRELVPGEILLAPEHENHYAYLLLSGTLGVHFDAPDSAEIRELSAGVTVGEMSIIDETMPSAYVVAKEASRVFPIHRDMLLHLVGDNNPIARNLLRLLARWIKWNTQRIIQDQSQIVELTDHAHVDALTEVYNRRWLDDTLPRILAQESKGDLRTSILLIDVDHFKAYNDTQGHQGGDQALMALGSVLKASVRPYDFVTRYGGEEFLVILQHTTAAEAVIVAERIRAAAASKSIASPEGHPLPSITVSIGLSISAPGSTPESLIATADRHLYRAKAEGRNRVCC